MGRVLTVIYYHKMNVTNFTKKEVKTISLILIALFVLIATNMAVSLRRGRDATRKDDMSAIQKSLDNYKQKYTVYPPSTDDGRIIGCFDGDVIQDKSTGIPLNNIVCDWGKSSFEDMSPMPRDPSAEDGINYKYIAIDMGYGFYVSLEGKDEPEYNMETLGLNLQCGNKMCNYGREVTK